MTQRYAIVPVYKLSDLDTRDCVAMRAGWTHKAQGMFLKGESAGKITRTQIETVSRAIANELGEDFENLGDNESLGWSKNHCRQLAVVAVKSIGLEVEEQK